MHTVSLRNLLDFVDMGPTLLELLDAASQLSRADSSWLLEASILTEEIGRAALSEPTQLRSIRSAVTATAEEFGCDLIVGASPVADEIVRSLNGATSDPSRALLFDLVRVTGASLSQGLAELRHIDVVPAVLLDLQRCQVESGVRTEPVRLQPIGR